MDIIDGTVNINIFDKSVKNTDTLNEVIVDTINEKKKRGRKPKVKTDEVKIPKKRGRKPTGKIVDYSKVVISNINDDDCIIAHLPIYLSDSDNISSHVTHVTESQCNNANDDSAPEIAKTSLPVKNQVIKSSELHVSHIPPVKMDLDTTIKLDNSEPLSEYDDIKNSMFLATESDQPPIGDPCMQCHKYEKKINELKLQLDTLLKNRKGLAVDVVRKVHELDVNLIDITNINNSDSSSETILAGPNRLKESINIACWWCCHTFDTTPIGLPDKLYNNIFYIFGCFCGFNCALSFNIDLNDYKTGERTTLLHLLQKKLYAINAPIMPAKPRYSLKLFGGPYTIEQFRDNFSFINKECRFILPPMTSIIPLIEEDYRTKFNNTNNDQKFVPMNSIKLANANKNILKRSKPLVSHKFSLEDIMGIKKKSI
ncbi:MAG: hypothetical protein Faunusvirus26_2 [Faunusvirus sp.]|jgi:hypothetical protein|uniref:Viral transcription factor 2 n=1 Tax=Faunusvirus sp. TaxID=2487766 RepID=A0A3G4ZXF4_9VIRU|nr:MAG: hypothetical protein Faunusvirus26_2 [Faunusvirus sp.]